MLGRATADLAQQHGVAIVGCDHTIPSSASDSYLHADVRDLGHMLEVMAGADAVVHLAAFKDDRLATPSETFRANVTATHNVLMAAKILGVERVVLASSIRVVVPRLLDGWPGYRYLPFDEDHPVFVQGEYARSKYVGETIADSMAAEFGLDIVSLRYTHIVDAGQAHYPIVASRDDLLGPHYIDVVDAARCTWLAAVARAEPGSHRRSFVTAADTTLRVPTREFAALNFPEAKWRDNDDGPFGSLVSGRRAAELFGFAPSVSWRDSRVEDPARGSRFWRSRRG